MYGAVDGCVRRTPTRYTGAEGSLWFASSPPIYQALRNRIWGIFGSHNTRQMAVILARALPEVLEEAMRPGIHAITLGNRSGLLLGCAGDASRAAAVGAIVSNMWQSHEKCEGAGSLGCLLVECEEGRLAIQAVGSFVLACCADETVPFGMLKAITASLQDFLQPPLSQLVT